ncbi:uncharacterized protein DUF4268 [Mucilaginibacter gracilis]|uniref:Uncharacterized protein DUF4268 n=1 Tax=Mucilaginibacter gracilis TaxID=423350 RepID=A0A495J7Z7_9SPHI|nr:DUF4268 domain-containing protein [Mucilaginibacter gracilis]RKR84871.1 uncharacterized protein DUF4268 [Mucilaginibacter gracilis]
MYSKDEASQIKQQFWTTFGQYIAPQPSAEGLKINWVNYKTGIKHLYFKMEADKQGAFIAIQMSHPDLEIQQMMFDQFLGYKTMLHATLAEPWEWALHINDTNALQNGQRTVTRIYKQLPGTSIFNQQHWPALISFFKPRIIALDEFWSDAQYGFDLFR